MQRIDQMTTKLNEFQHNEMLQLEMEMNLKGAIVDELKKIFLSSKDVFEYIEKLKELLK